MCHKQAALISLCLFGFVAEASRTNARGSEYCFPQVADGSYAKGYYSTTFTLSNPFRLDVPVVFRFFRSNGTSWSLTIQSKDRPELNGKRSSVSFIMRPQESVLFSTEGTDPLAVGWARLDADLPVIVSEVFGVFNRQPAAYVSSEAGVLPTPLATQFSFFATVSRDEPVLGSSVDTGLAIVNPSGSAALITATLFSRAGAQLSEKRISLTQNNHTALFVSQLFGDVSFGFSFHGRVSLSSNVNIAMVALRQTFGNSDTLATVSAVPDSTTSYVTFYDHESNDELATAQPILAFPAEIIGTINSPIDGADMDYYSVGMRQGEVLFVFVTAEFLNSALNGRLAIRDSRGILVSPDVDSFSPGLLDPFIRFQAPAAGIYFIEVGSVGKTYSRSSHYRLQVLVK